MILIGINTGRECGRKIYNRALLSRLGIDRNVEYLNSIYSSSVSFAVGLLVNNMRMRLKGDKKVRISANNTSIFLKNAIIEFHTLPFYENKYYPIRFLFRFFEKFYLNKNKVLVFNTELLKKKFEDIYCDLSVQKLVVWPDIVLNQNPVYKDNRGKSLKDVVLFSRIVRKKNILEKICYLESEGFNVTLIGRVQDKKYIEEIKRVVCCELFLDKEIEEIADKVSDYYWMTIGDFNEPYGITVVECINSGLLPIYMPEGNPQENFDSCEYLLDNISDHDAINKHKVKWQSLIGELSIRRKSYESIMNFFVDS